MTHWSVACCQQSTDAFLDPCPDAPSSARTFKATLEQWNDILNNPVEGTVYSVSGSGEAPYCATFTLTDPGGPYTSPINFKFAEVENCSDDNCSKRIWYFVPCDTPTTCNEPNRNVYFMAAYADTWQARLPGVGSLDPDDPSSYAGTWKFRMGEVTAVECNECVTDGLSKKCDTWCGRLQPFDLTDPSFCYENSALGNFPVCECCDVDPTFIQFIDSTFPGAFTAQTDCNDLDCYEPCAPIKCESNVIEVRWDHIISVGLDGTGITETSFTKNDEFICGGSGDCSIAKRVEQTVARQDAWQLIIKFKAYLNAINASDQPTNCNDSTKRTTFSLINNCMFIEGFESNNFARWNVLNPEIEVPDGEQTPAINFSGSRQTYSGGHCGDPLNTTHDFSMESRFYWSNVYKDTNVSGTMKCEIVKSRGWTDDVPPDAPCPTDPDDCYWFFNWAYPLNFQGYTNARCDDSIGDNEFLPATHNIGDTDPAGNFEYQNTTFSDVTSCRSVGFVGS